jgi:hypothetical protein
MSKELLDHEDPIPQGKDYSLAAWIDFFNDFPFQFFLICAFSLVVTIYSTLLFPEIFTGYFFLAYYIGIFVLMFILGIVTHGVLLIIGFILSIRQDNRNPFWELEIETVVFFWSFFLSLFLILKYY